MNQKTINKYAYILTLFGAISIGIDGLLRINILSTILGSTGLEDIIKIIIGASGVYLLATYNSKKK